MDTSTLAAREGLQESGENFSRGYLHLQELDDEQLGLLDITYRAWVRAIPTLQTYGPTADLLSTMAMGLYNNPGLEYKVKSDSQSEEDPPLDIVIKGEKASLRYFLNNTAKDIYQREFIITDARGNSWDIPLNNLGAVIEVKHQPAFSPRPRL